ncbi:Trk system potassium uptake protein TrkA [Alteracholeplasma palmae J233]|uniref:Trk system potassium uptake protein TrkA n=1 Tax=Alteracholeplasma palmae (strain ATCC 49389 / J233) TaxID=1318466 RepID=U4KLJ8_ALTPJ|nr:TrkA family potassium uptake protein [Alteracholeplasma palmae]CCV64728.1 Trk system potassium uptake protein TrkA [Alteracholeplasma palmae J233]
MKKSIAIIGLSRFGLNLVERLSKMNVDIIAIDKNKESVRKAGELTRNVYIVDSTNEDALKAAGIASVDHAIVAIGQNEKTNLSSSIMTIIKLKQLGIEKITARADEEDYVEVLKLVGATDVISPLSIASERIANKVASGNVVDYFNIKNDFDVYEIRIEENFEPLAITELDSRSKFKINILVIERDKKMIIPTKETMLMPNDEIFIFGRKKDIPKITEVFSKN